MYDLSGLGAGKIDDVIQDWRQLRTRMKLGEDAAYLHHRGKPVVAVWGVGFNDKRAYTLEECRRFIDVLKNDPEIGGCTVMLGVPTYWREQKNDALADPALHEIIAMADIVSPWTVGRYRTPEEAERHAEKLVKPDIAWCAERHLDYLPVVFPGFSWHNMYGSSNAIPRLRGEFLTRQFRADKAAGAKMLYVAMFDEVDEGTAIFKCTNDVPVPSEAPFVTYEGLPSDFYLRWWGRLGGNRERMESERIAESPLTVHCSYFRVENSGLLLKLRRHSASTRQSKLIVFLTALSLFTAAASRGADAKQIRVLIWDEQQPEQKLAYGDKYLGETIAAHLAGSSQHHRQDGDA